MQGRLLPGWNPKQVWPNWVSSVSLLSYKGQNLLAALTEKGGIQFSYLDGKNYSDLKLDSGYNWVAARFMQTDTASFSIICKDSIQAYMVTVSSQKPIKIEAKTLQTFDEQTKEPVPPIATNGFYLMGNLFLEADNWLIFADPSNKLNLYRLK